MVKWWAFGMLDETAVRISSTTVIKHNAVSGSSKNAHIPVMDGRPLKSSMHS